MAILSGGCTLTHSFTLPCPGQELAALYITYQQGGATVLEKTLADCAFEGALARVRLSQEDTLRCPASDGPIRIQLRLRTTAGTALKSGVLTAAPDELLKEGVI